MLLKANHNLILPDGETEIKIGETFEYKGDIRCFGNCVTPITAEEGEAPEGTEITTPEVISVEDEAVIRAKAKELKIPSYHNKGIEKLKAEIIDAEKAIEAVKAAEEGENPNNDPVVEEETTNGENENVGE